MPIPVRRITSAKLIKLGPPAGLVVHFDQGDEQNSTDSGKNEEQILSGPGPAQEAIVLAGTVLE
jgi:hypothetical protein